MYSGQGAQYAGMGKELYEREAIFRQTVDQCAAAFQVAQGYDLREVLYPAAGHEAEAEARLTETEVTQPALFVLEYGLTRLWQQWGLRIEALMGHSIGEYVAACVAGVMSVEDGVRLVGRRASVMGGSGSFRWGAPWRPPGGSMGGPVGAAHDDRTHYHAQFAGAPNRAGPCGSAPRGLPPPGAGPRRAC